MLVICYMKLTWVFHLPFKKVPRGASAVQLLEPQTLGFSSGHGFGVLGLSSALGSLLSGEPASPSPSAAPPAYALSLC